MLQIIGQSLLIVTRMDRADEPPKARTVRPSVPAHGLVKSVAAQIAASRAAWRAR
jgi:hypothetical protein